MDDRGGCRGRLVDHLARGRWKGGAKADALTLAGLSATALTEGIRFLYGQADELLKRRQERAGERQERSETPPVVAQPRELTAPDPDLVEQFRSDLEFFRTYLQPYVTNPEQARLAQGGAEPQLLEAVEALRGILGSVYQMPVVFSGERGEATVHGSVDVEVVAGYAAAIRAKAASGRIQGHVRASRVEAGGEVVGVDLVDGN
jgi:hypothetical protein